MTDAIEEANRQGSRYRCSCGYSTNADINAARNKSFSLFDSIAQGLNEAIDMVRSEFHVNKS